MANTYNPTCPHCGSKLEPGFYENVPALVCPNGDEYVDFDVVDHAVFTNMSEWIERIRQECESYTSEREFTLFPEEIQTHIKAIEEHVHQLDLALTGRLG